MVDCTSCGHPLEENVRFCSRCGQSTTTPASTPDPTPLPPPTPTPPEPPESTPPPTWGKQQTKGCLITLGVLAIVIAGIGLLIGTFCGEQIPEDPEERRLWEAERQTKTAEQAIVQQSEDATKAVENAIVAGRQTRSKMSEDAIKANEEATKEARKSLDQKRKDAGLHSCKDIEDSAVFEANFTLDLYGDIKDLDDHQLLRVDVDSDTPSITCSAKANLDNAFDGWTYIRYVAEWHDGILDVKVSRDVRRSRDEATKEARNN